MPRHLRLGALVAVRLGVSHVHPAPAYAGPERWREAALARRYSETDNPLLPCIDPTQQRYELIRPLLLCPEHTATQRAQETGTHPDTVGRLKRQFAHQGMLGLVPDTLEVLPFWGRFLIYDGTMASKRWHDTPPWGIVWESASIPSPQGGHRCRATPV